MNCNQLAKHYNALTPEEIFRLILAASDRGDEAERDRLAKARPCITVTMPAYSPYSFAFQEIQFLAYIELMDDVAVYQALVEQAEDARDDSINESKASGANNRIDDDEDEDVAADISEEAAVEWPNWHLLGRMSYAAGYVLKVKMVGWIMFCKRWNTAPLSLWEQGELPGLDRLKRALALAHGGFAFPSSAEVVRWANEVRPDGAPEQTEVDIITAERYSACLEAAFRERIRWWNG